MYCFRHSLSSEKPPVAFIMTAFAAIFLSTSRQNAFADPLKTQQSPLLIADVMPTLLPPVNPSATQPDSAVGGMHLNEALNETFLRSPRAASIRFQLGIAKSAIPQALTFPNPAFLLYNGFKAEQTYQVGASIPIEAPWKVFFRLILAKNQIKQADLEIMRSLWLLRGNVRRAYLDVVLAEEMATALTDLSDLSKRLLSVAERRAKAGDVAKLDVYKAHLATSQAEIERVQAARQVILTKRRLNVLLGRDHAAELAIPGLPQFQLKVTKNELLPDFDQSMPDLSGLIASAHESRLDVRLARQALKTNEAALRNTYSSIVPNTQFNVGHSITGNPPEGPKLNGYFIGITQEVPLGDFNQSDIAKYRAMIKQQKAEVDAQKNIVAEDVALAYEKVMIARERIQAYQEHVLTESQEVARLARRSYEVGQADITSALAALQSNIQVRSQYLDSVRSYQQAFTDLEQAIGKPL